ncbi:FkbM family methyltransferase [Pedobacter sp. UYEF25]
MSLIKGIIPKGFKDFLKGRLGVPNMFSSFKQMKKLGYYPEVILDIGAYQGEWTAEMSKIFSNAEFLMVEGQNEKEEELIEVTKKVDNCSYKIALLGAETKQVKFNKYETASSVLSEENTTDAEVEERTLITLDELLSTTEKAKDILVKIDTQGYELEILKGAKETLKTTKVVLLEVSMLNIYKGGPLVDEVILFMKERGFFLYDICSIVRRPLDNALYQSDFIFVKENVLNRNSTKWA